MPSFNDSFGFKQSPFQQYVAENEPHIDSYAVKPPYFVTVTSRAQAASSIVLFGPRGAGKSATRLTVFKELWKRAENKEKIPFPLNLTDFSSIIRGGIKNVGQSAYIRQLGFSFMEALLVWLGSLENTEREEYVENLNADERDKIIALLAAFYFNVPDLQRNTSTGAALRLLNQAWTTKASLWIHKNWSGLSTVVASLATAFIKSRTDSSGNEETAIKEMLDSLGKGDSGNIYTVEILQKLVHCAQIFGFSGIVVFADKIDETDATTNSSENTAAVVVPLLSQVQLLEVDGLGWIFFLWDKVKDHIGGVEGKVRLDKIAHADVKWGQDFLIKMIDSRLEFFSSGKIKSLKDFLSPEVDAAKVVTELVGVSMNSPRELIRLLDTVIREHDQLHSASAAVILLREEEIEIAVDKYVVEGIDRFANEKYVNQLAKLNLLRFTNKEVQGAFRVGVAPARNRIQHWVDAGLVKQTGTRAAEGDGGGKPNNEYSIIDSRLVRVVLRHLVEVNDVELEADAKLDEAEYLGDDSVEV